METSVIESYEQLCREHRAEVDRRREEARARKQMERDLKELLRRLEDRAPLKVL